MLPVGGYCQSEPHPKGQVGLGQEVATRILNIEEYKLQVGYPDSAKAHAITGRVTLKLLVDTLGLLVSHQVIRDPHPLLTQAAVNALPVLRFSPGVSQGKKVSTWVTLPIDFRYTPTTSPRAEKIRR